MRFLPSVPICVALIIGLPLAVAGQEAPAEHSINLLRAPALPAFVLLGLESSSISRPANVSDFALKFQSDTESLGVIPGNIGAVISPYWLSSHGQSTYDQFAAGGGGRQTFLESFSLSVASMSRSAEGSSVDTIALGVGISFSLLRGRIDTEYNDYGTRLQSIRENLDALLVTFSLTVEEFIEADPEIQRLEADLAAAPNQALADSIGPLIETELDRVTDAWERALRAGDSGNDLLSRIAEEAKDLRVKRKGAFLDLAAGAVWEFPGKVVDEKSLLNWGAWLTGGYEGTSTSALGLFRVLGDRPRDEVMFDVGLRVLVDQAGGFSASVEALHRWDSTQDDGGTWRTAVVIDYALPSNRGVSLTLGRDFAESTASQILAAINFAVGLGSARPLR